MPVAVFFDLDDTLTDWWSGIARAAHVVAPDDVVERLQAVIRGQVWERRAGVVVNRPHWKLLVEPERYWAAALSADRTADADEIAERFRRQLAPRLFPDAQPALRASATTHRLGVLSNNPAAEAVLEGLGVTEFFAAVVATDDAIRKPHPEAFRTACRALQLDPPEIVFVGDSPAADVEGAIAVGMATVWLDRYGDPWNPPAGVARIASLSELPAFLASNS